LALRDRQPATIVSVHDLVSVILLHLYMDGRQEHLSLSSISPSSSTTSTPSSTQLPPSFKADLKISNEDIERLVDKYNRQAIPVMEDEEFCKQLGEFVATAGGVDEIKLAYWIFEKSSRIDSDCVDAKTNISFTGLDFFDTDEQRHNMIAGLQGPTIHGYGRLID